MNTSVSFELAKLLKEKGFGGGQMFYYPETKELTENHRGDNYPAPTIAEMVMWLYEKHGIWIYLVPAEDNKKVFKPFFRGKNIIDQHLTEFFNSPTKAYEAAIEYTLNNLIK